VRQSCLCNPPAESSCNRKIIIRQVQLTFGPGDCGRPCGIPPRASVWIIPGTEYGTPTINIPRYNNGIIIDTSVVS
jgi:hypothetical protein